MHVALAQAGAGNAHELRLGVKIREALGADIAHGRSQPAGELVQHICDRTFCTARGPLTPSGTSLSVSLISCWNSDRRPARHGGDRAHAAIALIGTALIEKDLPRGLVGAGEQRADHGAVGARRHRLSEIAGIFDASVGDEPAYRVRFAASTASVIAVSCGTADTGDDAA